MMCDGGDHSGDDAKGDGQGRRPRATPSRSADRPQRRCCWRSWCQGVGGRPRRWPL